MQLRSYCYFLLLPLQVILHTEVLQVILKESEPWLDSRAVAVHLFLFFWGGGNISFSLLFTLTPPSLKKILPTLGFSGIHRDSFFSSISCVSRPCYQEGVWQIPSSHAYCRRPCLNLPHNRFYANNACLASSRWLQATLKGFWWENSRDSLTWWQPMFWRAVGLALLCDSWQGMKTPCLLTAVF